jgi:branched-chain amino acid transport system substrate-binding protein
MRWNRLCALALTILSILTVVATTGQALAQKKYDPGASDTEIKVGNIMPYSGPGSPYSLVGKTEAAYFNKVNAEGGINGRKIKFISYDDAYSPPKTFEQARKLVEGDQVLLLFQVLGTAHNTTIQKYMNENKVPQLFIATGATKWNDPQHFPWTMASIPSYQSEAHVYAKYLLANHPDGKIGILYQNDDYGKDYLRGFKDGIGGKMRIVAELPYEPSEPTVYSQIAGLQASDADVFFDASSAKFAAQAIKHAAEVGWRPVHVLNGVSASIGSVFKPAGLDNSKGILTASYLKDATDPAWKDDPGLKEWTAFMDKYFADGDKTSLFTVYGYTWAQVLVAVLGQCGDDLTRANVMRQAANLKNLTFGMLLPGITVSTSPNDYAPVKQFQIARFDGEHLVPFGPILNGESAGN